ncbi:hypothetical protein D3C80_1403120 [compost metagenome]
MISATHRSARSSSAGNGRPGSLAMPTGVVLTRPWASAMAAGRSLPAWARPAPKLALRLAASSAARAGSTSKMVSCCTPSCSRAWATAAPAPPAPICTTRSRATPGRPRRKPSAKPRQSVLWPTRLPSSNTTVFTAPMPRASGDSSSSSGMIACLHGKVMFRPVKPRRWAASSSSGRAALVTPSWSRSISRYR